MRNSFSASPAKAGVQSGAGRNWAPAFAGEAFVADVKVTHG